MSAPNVLFGAKGWSDAAGLVATQWADVRSDGNWGLLKGDESIIYFHDIHARDEFIDFFGGQAVTLRKKAQSVVTGDTAVRLLQAGGAA